MTVLKFAAAFIVFGLRCSADEPSRADHDPPDVAKLLDSVARGEAIQPKTWADEAVPQVVAELITLAEDRNSDDADLAVRALVQIGPVASDAIPALCRRLYHRRHSSRDWAIRALVAIGDPAVGPLKRVAKSASGQARAAAVNALIQLKQLSHADLEHFAADPDARVRVAVATELANAGPTGVRILVKLCEDPDSAVAVAAITALKNNQSDVQPAIMALRAALSRKGIEGDAVVALSHYGVWAQRSVPEILKLFSSGRINWYLYRNFDEDENSVLRRIGPPAADDVALVLPFLNHANEEIQMLAAECLTWTEQIDNEKTGDTIEAAITATKTRYQNMLKSPGEDESPGRVFMAIEFLIGALWHMTHDVQRVCRVLKQAAEDLDEPVVLSPRPDKDDLTDSERRLLIHMIDSEDRGLQAVGLDRASYFRHADDEVIEAIFRFADSDDRELADLAMQVLRTIGPTVGDRAAPILISRYRGGKLPLKTFAQAIAEMGIRNAECRDILESALPMAGQYATTKCIRALAKMTDDPIRFGQTTLELAGKRRISHSDALEVLQSLTAWSEATRKYVLLKLDNNDISTSRNALAALSIMDAGTGNDVSRLIPILEDESPEKRLAAAQAIYRINGSQGPLRTLLTTDEAFVGPEARCRYHILRAFGELGRSATPLLDLLPLESEDTYYSWNPVTILRAVGTPKAVRLLEQLAESPNWDLRRRATAALRDLQSRQEKR